MILLVALCGEKVHLADAKKCTFGRYGVIFSSACCGKKVHIPVERLDFACLLACCLLVNADAKKCTCRWKGMIFLCAFWRKSANCSKNLAAKKLTFRRKGVILLNSAAAEKCTLIEKIWRRKSAHSGGEV